MLDVSVPQVQPAVTFYVATNGNDTAPGTQERPFATLARAQQAMRQAAASGDVLTYIRGGTYFLSAPLVLTPADSGRSGRWTAFVAFPGEHPVISGGARVASWSLDANGRWHARLDAFDVRQIYVNGRRVRRPSINELGIFQPFGDWTNPHAIAGFITSDPSIASISHPDAVEVGFLQQWTDRRCPLQAFKPLGNGAVLLQIAQPCFYLSTQMQSAQAQTPAYLDNVFEALQPGQFYFDRSTKDLIYAPLPGEAPTTSEVVVPVQESVLQVNGTVDGPVSNVLFRGLTFAHTAWLGSSRSGFPEVQATFLMSAEPGRLYASATGLIDVGHEYEPVPAGVRVTYASNIVFDGATFTHMGGTGVTLGLGSSGVVIDDSNINDISGNGLQIGGVSHDDHHPSDTRMVLRGNVVANTTVEYAGQEYTGAVGIFAGYTDSTTLQQDTVAHLPYSGISMGWGWGETDAASTADIGETLHGPTPARGNRILANEVFDTGRTRSDTGGIYVMSSQPGSVIAGNRVHDDLNFFGGIYLDEASGGFTVTGNTVWNVQRPLFLNDIDAASCSIFGNSFTP